MLAHPDVEIVVNLTIPAAHAEVPSQTIAAGKHVWSEKPISIDRASGRALLDQANAAGLLVGVAPDTVLGPGVQTARRAIAHGDIGEPLPAQTVMQYPGPDIFHPNPEFLLATGAGPLFDIGPYYITTLIHIFGAVARVAAVGSKGRPTRTVQVGDRAGTEFPVEVPTHVSAIAQFASGGVSQSVFSFDSPLVTMGVHRDYWYRGHTRRARSEPLHRRGQDHQSAGVRSNRQRSGLADRPSYWRSRRARHRCAGHGPLNSYRLPTVGLGELAYHVLDTLMAIDEAIATTRTVEINSSVEAIPLVPEDWDPFRRHPRGVIEDRLPAPRVFVRRRVPDRRSSDGFADRR